MKNKGYSKEVRPSLPALLGGKPVRASFLPLCTPYIGEEEKAEVVAALESGWLSTGPRTKQFETDMQEYLGAKHAIALSSCTAGLHVALVAAGVGPGDEVITSAFTFASTANVILHVGAKLVLTDIRPDTYNISVDEIAKRITPKTRVIMPVHYGGQPCDMDEIADLARANDLLVIEDAATAIGAEYKDRPIGGSEDRIAVFSFYATKTMTTGEGGLVATGLDTIADRVRTLSLHGMSRDAWKRYSAEGSWFYEIEAPGYKYNMMDIQAALGICQLKRLDGFISRREEICLRYDDAFSNMDEVVTPWIAPSVRSSRYIYPIQVATARLTISRGQFVEALRAENIGTSVHYIPVHVHPYYRDVLGYRQGDYPIAESVYERLVSLPLFPHMMDKDVDDVITAVQRIVAHYRR
jgi:dTDP-4-amino-4,6-dideoxygalactose transaminase